MQPIPGRIRLSGRSDFTARKGDPHPIRILRIRVEAGLHAASFRRVTQRLRCRPYRVKLDRPPFRRNSGNTPITRHIQDGAESTEARGQRFRIIGALKSDSARGRAGEGGISG